MLTSGAPDEPASSRDLGIGAWLDKPLSDTFPERFPPEVPELSLWKQTPEAGLVAQITERGLFSEKLVQAQDGSNLIVLDPQPPQ